MLYQSLALSRRIDSIIHDIRYPAQAVRIARVFALLVDQTRICLWNILQKKYPLSAGPINIIVLRLADGIRELNAYLRFLHASDPISAPPSVQAAISDLVNRYVAPALGCVRPDEEVVALVRPQWRYNFKFIDLFGELAPHIEISFLDPNFELDFDKDQKESLYTFIEMLWDSRQKTDPTYQHVRPPRHVAILSFASLDRGDVLLSPLLAHELGHFIDLCTPGTLFHADDILARVMPRDEEFAEILALYHKTPRESVAFQQIESAKATVDERLSACLAELVADLLAARMVGLPFFVALAEFLKNHVEFDGFVISDTGYPGALFRLKCIWDELLQLEPNFATASGFRDVGDVATGVGAPRAAGYFQDWKERFENTEFSNPAGTALYERLDELAARKVREVLPSLREKIREVIKDQDAARLPTMLPLLMKHLDLRLPPFLPEVGGERPSPSSPPRGFSDILAAAWFYELGSGGTREESEKTPETQFSEYRDTCALVFKALELDDVRDVVTQERDESLDLSDPPPRPVGVVTGPSIRRAVVQAAADDGLMIVPRAATASIGPAGIDLHLGNWFRVAKRTEHSSIKLNDQHALERARREGHDEVYVRRDDEFVLPPGGFALAATIEYVSMPRHLMAYLAPRSSLGRVGLIIGTAGQMAPGFKGCCVLELFNAGNRPLCLRPGLGIAQLIFHPMDGSSDGTVFTLSPYNGQFRCQVKP